MTTQLIDFPTVSDDPQAQAFYEAMRASGQSHNIAEMLALRQTPATVTDRELLAGHCNGSQFANDPAVGDFYKAEARRAGVGTEGKVYLHGLAEYPGDPKAWVDSRADIKRRCVEANMNCDGLVKHKARIERKPSVPLAQDIVNDRIAAAIIKDPGLKLKKRSELEAEIREKHTPHWHKKAGRTFDTMKGP